MLFIKHQCTYPIYSTTTTSSNTTPPFLTFTSFTVTRQYFSFLFNMIRDHRSSTSSTILPSTYFILLRAPIKNQLAQRWLKLAHRQFTLSYYILTTASDDTPAPNLIRTMGSSHDDALFDSDDPDLFDNDNDHAASNPFDCCFSACVMLCTPTTRSTSAILSVPLDAMRELPCM